MKTDKETIQTVLRSMVAATEEYGAPLVQIVPRDEAGEPLGLMLVCIDPGTASEIIDAVAVLEKKWAAENQGDSVHMSDIEGV